MNHTQMTDTEWSAWEVENIPDEYCPDCERHVIGCRCELDNDEHDHH